MRLQISAAPFYWLPISGCFSSLSSSSLSFCLISFSSVVSHSLGRGRISCSQVGWFLGGAKRPDSRLKPAGLPPDTMYVKPRTRKTPFLRTQPAAGRRLGEGANPAISIGLPKGQGDPRQPGMEMFEVVLVALETFPLLLLALNSVEVDQADKPSSTQAVLHPSRCSLQAWLCLRGSYWNKNHIWTDFSSPQGETLVA